MAGSSQCHPVQEEGGLQEKMERLSKDDQDKVQLLIQRVLAGEATLDFDRSGNVDVNYKHKSLAHVDKSQANLIASPKSPEDIKRRMEASLAILNRIKESRAPSGVNFDKTKVTPKSGRYREGEEYEVKMGEVLGKGNSCGDIVVIRDKGTGQEHAMKTVMISEFREDEIQAWVDLSDSGIAPALYMFQLRDNKVHLHMEKLIDSVSLQTVLDEKLDQIYKQDSNLLRPFSLFVFHGMLKAAQTMHDKNWAHGDMHGGNILLQNDADRMDVKVVDFGRAKPIKDPSGTLTAGGVESDILEIVRNFTALYTGEGFENFYELKREEDRKLRLQEVTEKWSKERREELFELVAMAMAVVDRESKHFHRPGPLIHKLEEKMGEDYVKAMKTVAGILFSTKELQAHEEMDDEDFPDGVDSAGDEDEEVPDSFIHSYLQSLGIRC